MVKNALCEKKKRKKRKKKFKNKSTLMADVEMGEVSEDRKCYRVCGVGVFFSCCEQQYLVLVLLRT